MTQVNAPVAHLWAMKVPSFPREKVTLSSIINNISKTLLVPNKIYNPRHLKLSSMMKLNLTFATIFAAVALSNTATAFNIGDRCCVWDGCAICPRSLVVTRETAADGAFAACVDFQSKCLGPERGIYIFNWPGGFTQAWSCGAILDRHWHLPWDHRWQRLRERVTNPYG